MLETVDADQVAEGAVAVHLSKGFYYDHENRRPRLISRTIEGALGVRCGVLAGANVGREVAEGKKCESTLATPFDGRDLTVAFEAFDAPNFSIRHVGDIYGTEMFGALKNIVALGAGYVDALEMGNNTKSALIRVGMKEMDAFVRLFSDSHQDTTILESCGVADLITTCYGGRNRLCAEAYARKKLGTGGADVEWSAIETEHLDGQKLQGTVTLTEIYRILVDKNLLDEFPLITTIHGITFEGRRPEDIVNGIVDCR
jgi:glycerol-3-phosphate dehydrogenase (NAD+)